LFAYGYGLSSFAVGGLLILTSAIAISMKYETRASPSSSAISRAANNAVSKEGKSAGRPVNIPTSEWIG
jgi:hypothetical protein